MDLQGRTPESNEPDLQRSCPNRATHQAAGVAACMYGMSVLDVQQPSHSFLAKRMCTIQEIYHCNSADTAKTCEHVFSVVLVPANAENKGSAPMDFAGPAALTGLHSALPVLPACAHSLRDACTAWCRYSYKARPQSLK